MVRTLVSFLLPAGAAAAAGAGAVFSSFLGVPSCLGLGSGFLVLSEGLGGGGVALLTCWSLGSDLSLFFSGAGSSFASALGSSLGADDEAGLQIQRAS